MKYTIYYKGDKVKLFNDDYNYVVNMYKAANASSCSVDTGGDITLSNGDILHINKKNGPLDYEQNTYGIGFTLESGTNVVAVMSIDDLSYYTINNCFYGINSLYKDWNVLSLYQISTSGFYDKMAHQGSDAAKNYFWQYGVFYGAIILKSNKWQLATNNVYSGQSFRLSSGERITISGFMPPVYGESAIYYVRSSGANSAGYYISEVDENWRQTSYNVSWCTGYFDPVRLQEDDEIHIYHMGETEWYDLTQQEGDEWDSSHGIPESIAQREFNLLCTFKIINQKWVLMKDYSTGSIPQTCSVEDGGNFVLENNDILYINEQNGELANAPSDDPCFGIGLSLESGHEFMAVLLMPNQSSWQTQMSIYGTFFDIDAEYEEGNIIHIYDLSACDSYEDLGDNGYSNEHEFLSHPGVVCNAVLVLQDNEWVLTDDPCYLGQYLTLSSGEEIFVSGPMAEDNNIGLYFTLSSGRTSLALYYDASQRKYTRHSSYNWLAPTPAAEGDCICIFLYYEGEDYSQYTGDYDFHELDFDTAAQFTKHLCTLQRVNNQWKIVKDNS